MDERVKDLISRLDDSEKPYLLTARESPKGSIPRLGIPEYDWGGNCTTVFSLGVAATSPGVQLRFLILVFGCHLSKVYGRVWGQLLAQSYALMATKRRGRPPKQFTAYRTGLLVTEHTDSARRQVGP